MSEHQLVDIETLKPTRIGSVMFGLFCAIPLIATILFGAVDSITWALLVILTSVLIVLWLIESWRAKGLMIGTSSLQLPLVALIAIGLIQVLLSLSLDPYSTRFFIRNLIVFLIFLTAGLTFVGTEKRLKKLVFMIVIFGAMMAFIGILQKIGNADAIYGIRVPFQANPFGPFVNQHHFAGFMEMTGGLVLGLIFGSMAREKKFLLGIALVVMVAALILTSSRGGMLSFAAVTIFTGTLSFFYRRRYDQHGQSDEGRAGLRGKTTTIVAVLAVVLVVIGLVFFLGGDESLTRGIGLAYGGTGDDVSNGRLHFWGVALKIFFAHPIFGAGFDAFGVAFTRYDTWSGLFRIEQAHNDYLQMLADGGILGFACVAAFIVLLFRKGLKTIAASERGFRREAAIGALAGCFGIMVHSFFDFPLRTWSNTFFLLLLVTIATVSIKSSEPELPKRRRRSSTSR